MLLAEQLTDGAAVNQRYCSGHGQTSWVFEIHDGHNGSYISLGTVKNDSNAK